MVDLFGNACKLFQKCQTHVSFISYMIMMATISNMGMGVLLFIILMCTIISSLVFVGPG